MNEKLIPANSPYWDYKMLTLINGKRKETIADRQERIKAKRRSEIIDKVCMTICMIFGYGCVAYLLFFAP